MIVLKIDPNSPDLAMTRQAADAILRGDLVIFPTETVYGLAANALDEAAVLRVFEAKGRSPDHPLPVQIADVEQLEQVADDVSEAAMMLAGQFWPGPLTLVLRKSGLVPAIVTGGSDTVGVRVPDHPVALALLRELREPIVATSANTSGQQPPTDAHQAANDVGSGVAIVLDAGPCRLGVESTVVDMTVSPHRILRHGAISEQEIRMCLET